MPPDANMLVTIEAASERGVETDRYETDSPGQVLALIAAALGRPGFRSVAVAAVDAAGQLKLAA